MVNDFIPTLGNCIEAIDSIIRSTPPNFRNDYAKLFADTEIEKLLFSTARFEEQASEYCRESGWREPS